MSLATVAQARERMLAALAPLDYEAVALADAAGRVLAQAITAHRPQPPFAASAMDGWAVAADPAERCLAIIGESAAGRGFAGKIDKGSAVRIFTGAAVPAGADAVVIQEEASRQGERVRVPPCVTGQNIRPAGQDFRPGEVLLAAGLRLDPWRLGLAAAAGLGAVRVARRPRIAILATGEELALPGETPGPFQIFNSGTPTLAALVRMWGAQALCLPIAVDSAEAIVAAARAAKCEVLVTLGGASVGDYDLVKPALAERLGLTLQVDGVAVRPGKPTWFGRLADGRAVLGLPGNPASALVCAELFLRPIIDRLQGRAGELRLMTALAGAHLAANGGREHWMRARLDRDAGGAWRAWPFADQDSSLVTVFAAADALIGRPIGAPALAAGDPVEVLPLDRLG